ncbi:alpha/beta hydrolase [Pseudonocardia oroxyli]|nr:alpha/beta hydrolase [Pseudonocardia oroxyli]
MDLSGLGIASLLLSLLVIAVRPLPAPALGPVGLDPVCAAFLTTKVTDGDERVRVLGCDPAGRGRAVVAIGDVATAANVVVLVPGSDIDLHTLDGSPRRPMTWARSLAASVGRDTVVVLWVGYETPQGLGYDAAAGRLARAAAPALVAEVAALRAGGARHVTVVGHSYGSVVVGIAAPALDADDLVLLASPGVRAESVEDLHTRARVWVARAGQDWIRFVPHVRLGDLGHGADPAAPGFGARPLPVDGLRAHDGYLLPGSPTLAAVAGIARGEATRP